MYQDNGPENHSRRTQFMYRMTQFTDQKQLTIRLAYYPPYHSKYNFIERVWSALEQHWNGSLVRKYGDCVAICTVHDMARKITCRYISQESL